MLLNYLLFCIPCLLENNFSKNVFQVYPPRKLFRARSIYFIFKSK